MGRGNKKKGASVQISNEEYKKLLSRPKQSTLRKDSSIQLRKGKLGNPYSQTLLDPIRVTGVKVPDVTSFPTSTFQAYDRQDYTIAAHGTFGIAFQPVLYSFYAQCLNLDGATAYNNWSGQAQSTAMNGIYHSYRPVSACMRIWTNANATSNSGEIAAAYLAKDQTLAAGTMGTFDKIAKRFGSFRGPLREGLEILWMPQDATSRMYLLTATTTTNQAIGSNWPGMVAGVSGATSGSVVSVEWYVNYEAIPEQSTFNLVNATAPYVNNGDLESATALISKLGSFARPLGQDLSSWVYSQGAVVAGEIGKHIAGRAIHYMSNRIGMGGRPSTSSILG